MDWIFVELVMEFLFSGEISPFLKRGKLLLYIFFEHDSWGSLRSAPREVVRPRPGGLSSLDTRGKFYGETDEPLEEAMLSSPPSLSGKHASATPDRRNSCTRIVLSPASFSLTASHRW